MNDFAFAFEFEFVEGRFVDLPALPQRSEGGLIR